MRMLTPVVPDREESDFTILSSWLSRICTILWIEKNQILQYYQAQEEGILGRRAIEKNQILQYYQAVSRSNLQHL